MTGICAPQGWASEVAVQKGATFDAGATPFHFKREGYEQVEQLRIRDVKTGSRGIQSIQVKPGLKYSQGDISFEPTPNSLATWLELIMGGAPAGNVYDFAKTLPEFMVGKNLDTAAYQYQECKVNRAIFECRANDQLNLTTNVVGGAESVVDPWPTFTTPVGENIDDQAYGFEESTLTLGGNAIDMFYFRLVVENFLTPRIINNQLPSRWCPARQREVSLQIVVPFATANELGLYNTTKTTEIEGSINFVNGNVSTLFNFPNLRNQPRTPKSIPKSEITHTLNYIATDDAAAKAMTVTNDSDPAP